MPETAVADGAPRKLEAKLLHAVGRAIADFRMIEDGDRVLVGLSGGKDSFTLLTLLLRLQQRAPIRFELEAANLDPGYAGYRPDVVEDFARQHGVPIHMLNAPIEQLVREKIAPGKAACPLCSRIRRGALYSLARRISANKLALGHHLDDAIETLLMNLFYAGTLRSMPPRMLPDDGPPLVIRPLCYALERDIATYATATNFPIIPCASPHCADADRRRQVVKRVLSTLESEHPDIKLHMRKAMGNVQADALFDPLLQSTLQRTTRMS